MKLDNRQKLWEMCTCCGRLEFLSESNGCCTCSCPIFLHITQRCDKKTDLQFSLCLLNIQTFDSWRPLKADPGFQTFNPGWRVGGDQTSLKSVS